MKTKLTLDDCVYLCLKDGAWWTFWHLQEAIKGRTGTFYGEPSISAAIRNLRKLPQRAKYNFSPFGEVIEKRRRLTGKGYQYRLTQNAQENRYEQRRTITL